MKYSVNGVRVVATENETLVAGSLGVCFAEFAFDSTWDAFPVRKAVFKREDTVIEMLITSGRCEIPWEVLAESGVLHVGVYGESADKRRPTLWASPKTVNPGTEDGDNTHEPTPDDWQQLLYSISEVTPHIGANGNWYVGEADTGICAHGEPGRDYVITEADKAEMVSAVLAALPNGDEVSY